MTSKKKVAIQKDNDFLFICTLLKIHSGLIQQKLIQPQAKDFVLFKPFYAVVNWLVFEKKDIRQLQDRLR